MTLTLLNGQNVASTGWFVFEPARRSFNYALLPSELVGDIKIYKSSQADLAEGGIGGTRHMEKLVIRKLKADLTILKSDKSWLTNMDYLKEREDKIIQELKLELYKLKPKITRIVEAIADGFDTAEMRSKLLLLDQRKQ